MTKIKIKKMFVLKFDIIINVACYKTPNTVHYVVILIHKAVVAHHYLYYYCRSRIKSMIEHNYY
jgi:hypothetical protein